MTLDGIISLAHDVRKRCKGRSIYETAENAGVKVWHRPLGGLKGFYICENGIRYIVINDALDEMTSRVVCAHELGHDMMHRELSVGGIRESTMFLDGNKTEREANLFAAELLINDKDIISELQYTNSPEAAAYELGVPAELLQYKLELLAYKGYDVNYTAVNNDFLK